jgi:hypothetical protein
MSNRQRSLVWIGVIALIVVGVGGGIFLNARAGNVTGETARERVASVTDIARRDAIGAANSLAEAVRTDPEPEVRRAAIVCLTRYRRPEDRPVIETALEDDSLAVRQQAVRAMVSMYDDQATVDLLAQIFADGEDVAAAEAAAMALARSKQLSAVVPLFSALEAPPHSAAGLMALKALDSRLQIGFDLANADEETLARYVQVLKGSSEVIAACEEAGVTITHDMELARKMTEEHALHCHSVGAGDKPLPLPGETLEDIPGETP